MTGVFGLKNPKTEKIGNPSFWLPQYIAPSHNAKSDRNMDLKKNKKKTNL